MLSHPGDDRVGVRPVRDAASANHANHKWVSTRIAARLPGATAGRKHLVREVDRTARETSI